MKKKSRANRKQKKARNKKRVEAQATPATGPMARKLTLRQDVKKNKELLGGMLVELSKTLPVIAHKLEELDTVVCLLYTSPSPRDQRGSRMPSSA